MTQLHSASAAQLLALYATREASPVEASRAVIAHIEAREPRLHDTYAFDPEDALAQAQLGVVQMAEACERMRPAQRSWPVPRGA
jgi:Asp-tRNA(Asn)/Glu-tRNA(Gln) amidotransferase A subunit family amidase